MNPAKIIAILRGITPSEVNEIGDALVDAGIRHIEVPLNSPQPFVSIAKLVASIGDQAILGAGTVMTLEQCQRIADVGGKLVVSPHGNPMMIRRSLDLGLVPVPGFATPTEAFNCIAAGAKHLKLFPGGALGYQMPKSLQAVLPADIHLYAVGGVTLSNARTWLANGVSGLGIGSGLYRPGDTPQEVFRKAREFVSLIKQGEQ